MKLSQTFGRTLKIASGESESANYQLLVRGGFIQQVGAGVYTYLPLGLKVLNKIADLVRSDMDKLGASEILMPVLHPKNLWQKTGRWDKFDALYRLKDNGGREMALGPTHEETVTPLAQAYLNSYKDLPAAVYQIQTKFRDEPRAKGGLLRGREFLMKDLYSFHADSKDLDNYYELVKKAYQTAFHNLGLAVRVVESTGGAFSKYSHEFQVFHQSGEDTVLYCEDCDFAQNNEIAKVKAGDACPECKKKEAIKQTNAIEVGNTFKLGDRFSRDFGFSYTDQNGKQHHPVMGCYGIGISRAMGAIVEVYNDEKGILWPRNVAPADIHLICLGDDQKVKAAADKLYQDLQDNGNDVIYDDRLESAGIKFTDADLIGCPVRLTVSPKTLEHESAELKFRNIDKAKLIPLAEASEPLKQK
ncbi:MAG TPA: aminoacyl--tRNA ligase-related protein [Candidatus Dormibacteraeota bacterium]|nr:aminoacyl--tRNA ligase-related protein [Candidatus Dormibacteraeota bacterium]